MSGVLGVFWGCFGWVWSMWDGPRAKFAILAVILAVLEARGEAFWGLSRICVIVEMCVLAFLRCFWAR